MTKRAAPLVSVYAWAVLSALRQRSWCWADATTVRQWSARYRPVDQPVERVRAMLDAYAAEGLIDRRDPDPPHPGRYRWPADPPERIRARHLAYESITAEQGCPLAPVAEAPTECDEGHPLTGDNLVQWAEGTRGCRRCAVSAHGDPGVSVNDHDQARAVPVWPVWWMP